MNDTNWVPGLIVLAAGLLAGVLFVLFSRRGAPTGHTPDSLADLEQRYRSLIAQLKELVGDRHQLPPAQFEAEKTRLELAAASALRARDQFATHGQHQAEKAAALAEKLERAVAGGTGLLSPKLRGGLMVCGAAAFFVVLGMLLSQETKARDEREGITGRRAALREEAAPPEDSELRRVMAKLAQGPDDLQTLAEASHLLIVSDDYTHAATLTDRGLGIDPFHLETRVHRAVLRAVKGDSPGALGELLHLADTFPDSGEALLFAGAVALQLNDKSKALESFERFWAEAAPSDRSPRLGEQIALLRRELGRN